MRFTFQGELWQWDARRSDSWTFVSLPAAESEEIRELVGPRSGPGFGAVKVRVTVGGTSWSTSLFPSSGGGCYVLPVKKAVRRSEDLETGDTPQVTVELLA